MSTGFKEWKSVCNTLECGDQTIILRKGGIAEGKEGFLWKHREFFLFPTAHHDHRDQLKTNAETEDASFAKRSDGKIEIHLHARIIWSADLNNLEMAAKLSPYHIWKPEVIEQRFDYSENKGIRLALLRVSRLKDPWVFDDSSAFGGCRSWLELPAIDQPEMEPVLSEADFLDRQKQLESILNKATIEITKFDQ